MSSLTISATQIPASTHTMQPKPAASGETSKPANKAPVDTVHISNAANGPAKAALQETTETQAQTVGEAQNGDLQAKRLLAKEAAAKALAEYSKG